MPQAPQKPGDAGAEEPSWLPKVGETVDLNNLAVRRQEHHTGIILSPLRSEHKNMAEVIAVGKPDKEGNRLIDVRYPERPDRAEVRMTHQFDKYGNLIYPNYYDQG